MSAFDTPIPLGVCNFSDGSSARISNKYGVKGTPTLIWFQAGKPTTYEGGRSEEELVKWIKNAAGTKAADAKASKTKAAKLKQKKRLTMQNLN